MQYTDINFMPVNLVGTQANQIFFEPIWQAMSMSEFGSLFFIDRTIPSGGKRKMIIAGKMSHLMRTDTGCGGNVTGSMSISERELETRASKGLARLCYDDFRRQIFNQMQNGGNRMDKSQQGTFIMAMFLKAIQDAVQGQIIANAFFGSYANPDETLQMANGLFSVLLEQAENEGMPVVSDYGGVSLGVGAGLQAFKDVYRKQTKELNAVNSVDKRFIASRGMVEALEDDVELGTKNTTGYKEAIVDGQNIKTYKGVPIIQVDDFDEQWENLTGQENGNLMLLTHKNNLQLGTDGSALGTMVKTFYEEKDEMEYARVKASLGFNYASEKLMVAAFNRPNVV